MESVLIVGAGPQARIIPDVVAACDNLQLLGFVDVADERRFMKGDATQFPVYDVAQFPVELRDKLGNFSVLIGNDLMDLRPQLINQVREARLLLVNIIHPSALISRNARLGRGILILPGVIVGPGTTIGNHVILNSAVTIDHDSVLQDNIIIGPGVHLPGGVVVKNDTVIGVGACSVPGVTIGRNCIIGAGSVITKDVPDNVVAAGAPAKVIRTRE